MSDKPPVACRTPGCSGYAAEGGRGKCSDCVEPVSALAAPHDYHRQWAHLYRLARWKNLRLAILRRDPVCKICQRAESTIADHVRDHRGDLKLFYDPNNLQGLCKPCHDGKTGATHGSGTRTPPVKPALVAGIIYDYALDN